jgi:hypothetical protein
MDHTTFPFVIVGLAESYDYRFSRFPILNRLKVSFDGCEMPERKSYLNY